jgi:thymidylate kinase
VFTPTQIQVILDQEAQVAKESLRAGDQDKARRALRRRKYQETLLQQTYGQLEQLEQLVSIDNTEDFSDIHLVLGGKYRVLVD